MVRSRPRRAASTRLPKIQTLEHNWRLHPSGRPIHEHRFVRLSYLRIPREDYLTPRLQKRDLVDAIGFTSGPLNDYEEDDWEDE